MRIQRNTVKLTGILVLLGMIGMQDSCIEEYIPDIEAGESRKYVVSGQLTTEREEQVISVALASSIRHPGPVPLNDCTVRIADENGNSFAGTEFEGGKYRIRIPRGNLIAGLSYRLEITTPAGASLVSDFEELLDCPDIDSVYFTRESLPTNDPGVFIEGIQFYLDLDARGYENAYYKFDVEETWEYHSEYPLEWYYDGEFLHHVEPWDYSHSVCWKTRIIPDIFILNTAELQNNTYRRYLFHFVDNTTQRLVYLYSILVKQYAVSQQAYVYWDQLRMNNVEQESLYETQPLPVQGNLKNLTDPEQPVLGNIVVSSVKTKRIFVKDVPDLEINFQPDCAVSLLRYGLRDLTPDVYRYPVYLYIDRNGFFELTPECIFCEMMGGSVTPPPYWPDPE
jgi:hypothetical protein